MKPVRATRHAQKGMVLIMSLLFVLVLALIGVSSTQTASLELKLAVNDRDRGLAFQAAEAALMDAENFLRNTDPLPAFDGSEAGLVQAAGVDSTPRWWSLDWATESRAYSGTLEGISEPPRYLIEELPPMPMPGGSLQSNVPLTEKGWYRITARGSGATTSSTVVLQSVYKR